MYCGNSTVYTAQQTTVKSLTSRQGPQQYSFVTAHRSEAGSDTLKAPLRSLTRTGTLTCGVAHTAEANGVLA